VKWEGGRGKFVCLREEEKVVKLDGAICQEGQKCQTNHHFFRINISQRNATYEKLIVESQESVNVNIRESNEIERIWLIT